MAISSKIQPPSPQIFTSDPLEQIYAKDMFNAGNKGGLAYMMLNAAQDRRDADQGTYMQGLEKSNSVAYLLSQLEEQFKHRQEMAKLSAGLIPHGVLASAMPGSRDFLPDPAAGDAAARAILNKINSETAKNQAVGANAGATKVTGRIVMPGFGTGEAPQAYDVKGSQVEVDKAMQAYRDKYAVMRALIKDPILRAAADRQANKDLNNMLQRAQPGADLSGNVE